MSWTREAIHVVRQAVVDEIREKLKERGFEIVSLAHGIGGKDGSAALALRLQVEDTTIVMKAYEEVVAEIVQNDPNHALATMPIDVKVMGIAVIG